MRRADPRARLNVITVEGDLLRGAHKLANLRELGLTGWKKSTFCGANALAPGGYILAGCMWSRGGYTVSAWDLETGRKLWRVPKSCEVYSLNTSTFLVRQHGQKRLIVVSALTGAVKAERYGTFHSCAFAAGPCDSNLSGYVCICRAGTVELLRPDLSAEWVSALPSETFGRSVSQHCSAMFSSDLSCVAVHRVTETLRVGGGELFLCNVATGSVRSCDVSARIMRAVSSRELILAERVQIPPLQQTGYLPVHPLTELVVKCVDDCGHAVTRRRVQHFESADHPGRLNIVDVAACNMSQGDTKWIIVRMVNGTHWLTNLDFSQWYATEAGNHMWVNSASTCARVEIVAAKRALRALQAINTAVTIDPDALSLVRTVLAAFVVEDAKLCLMQALHFD